MAGERIARQVLVIEDDPATASGIARGLRSAGFEVELQTNGKAGAARLLNGQFDVAVLDLMLPEQDGLEILDQARYRCATPIIVLTARDGLADRLKVFDHGAADFLPKPFFIEELIARINTRTAPSLRPTRTVSWRDVTVDLDARHVSVAGQRVQVTPTELAILIYLVERPGRAVSRAALAEHALASLEEPAHRTVDSHVARLRKKLGAGGADIETVWGIGYRIDLSGEP